MAEFDQLDDYSDASACFVCEITLAAPPINNPEQDLFTVRCTNCGDYRISRSAIQDLLGYWREKPSKIGYLSLLSHKIRLRQRPDSVPFIDSNSLGSLFEGDLEFPNAVHQIESLVIFLAESLRPGEEMNVSYKNCQAVAGSSSAEAFGWVLKSAYDNGWVEGVPRGSMVPFELLSCTLTLRGWEWFNEIGRHKQSRTAFMAMKYGESVLTSIVNDHFRPAVAKTGFELKLLNDDPEAGIIDNRLRVEIRRSRFLIADLTHRNNGAYWEAGFGEGLGLPVIYTCEKSSLSDNKVHFDTRNSLIVPWEVDNPEEAATELKAIIRNTLPDESVLEDPEP